MSFLPHSFHQGLPARRWHKIKSQWLTAEETRNATRLLNHELIDCFGKGLTPHLRTSKKPYKIHPCVHRLANGKLAVVSRRKPRERTFNYPSMDYLDELKPYMPKTFEFDPDQHEYIPNWGILLPYMEEHCLFKREEVEILKKKLSPWNRQKEKKKEYLRDSNLVNILRKVKPDIECLYKNLEETPGFYGKEVPESKRISDLKEEAINILADLNNPRLKVEYAKIPKLYNVSGENKPRDFIGRILQKIIKDQLNKETDYQVLYEAFREI